jgi:hypothetical protein
VDYCFRGSGADIFTVGMALLLEVAVLGFRVDWSRSSFGELKGCVGELFLGDTITFPFFYEVF